MKDIMKEELIHIKEQLDIERKKNQVCYNRFKTLRSLLISSRDSMQDAIMELDVILNKLIE